MTQPQEHISVSEGGSVQVNCNYSYSGSPFLFWYVQYPRGVLQLLRSYTTGKSANGFTADLNKGEKSFHLKKASAQEADTATYYCVLSGTVTALAKPAERKPLRSSRNYVSVLSVATVGRFPPRQWR